MAEAESHSLLATLLQQKQRGSVRGASETAKILMKTENHPLPPALAREMVEALIATYDYELAQEILKKNERSSDPRWIAQWLELKWRTKFEPSIIDLEFEFTLQFGHLDWVKIRYLRKLISLKKFKAAQHFVGEVGLCGSSQLYFRLRYLLVLALGWSDEIIRSTTAAFAKDQELLSVQLQIGVASNFMNLFIVDCRQSVPTEIDNFLETFPVKGNLQLTRVRLKRALHGGYWHNVQTILENHPEFSEHPIFVQASMWLAKQLGDLPRARSIFCRKSYLLNSKALRQCRVGELIKIDEKSLSSRASIRLFTVVRNEAARIPWFLDFYRTLGVNQFFFVDNGSTDGTREVLLSQPDVHVFYTDTKYSEGASGMVWVNELTKRFGRNGWNLYVDVDEALIFQNSERDGLDYLTRYMERNDQEALPAFMLDMHARRGFATPTSSLIEKDFIKAYPFYHANFKVEADFSAPYYRVIGGGRHYLFREHSNQVKTPLIRGGRGILFLGSSHTISPALVSDISAALLHFRMTDEFFTDVNGDLTQGHRAWHCDLRQTGYLNSEFEDKYAKTDNPHIYFYENSESLLRSGLISAPRRYSKKDF